MAYEKMTVAELRKLAADRKIKGRSALKKKADLVKALRAHSITGISVTSTKLAKKAASPKKKASPKKRKSPKKKASPKKRKSPKKKASPKKRKSPAKKAAKAKKAPAARKLQKKYVRGTV